MVTYGWKYIWLLPASIGLIGNFLAIAVTLQKQNRVVSMCCYMRALALADSAVLLEWCWSMPLYFWKNEKIPERLIQ